MDLVLLSGCFWGMQHVLRDLPGVGSQVGYAADRAAARLSTYYNLDVTGHAEAVKVVFQEGDLEAVLSLYAHHQAADPSPPSKPRYRRAVLCPDETSATRVRAVLVAAGCQVAVTAGWDFVPAEDYHQGYYCRQGA